MRNPISLFFRRLPRRRVWQSWYEPYDENPFGVDGTVPRSQYEALAEAARNGSRALDEAVRARFGHAPDEGWLDELALATQVVVKDEPLTYAHGPLLYGALRTYAESRPDDRPLTILETGTARGFSAVCLARALEDAGRAGRIVTIDVLHAERPILWNSAGDEGGPRTRLELLAPWSRLVEDHVVFMRGHSQVVLEQLGLTRVHFAFLDGEHSYSALHDELGFVSARQQAGDVVICDDYTPSQFPGVAHAVDELVTSSAYDLEVFGDPRTRGYAYLSHA